MASNDWQNEINQAFARGDHKRAQVNGVWFSTNARAAWHFSTYRSRARVLESAREFFIRRNPLAKNDIGNPIDMASLPQDLRGKYLRILRSWGTYAARAKRDQEAETKRIQDSAAAQKAHVEKIWNDNVSEFGRDIALMMNRLTTMEHASHYDAGAIKKQEQAIEAAIAKRQAAA